MILPECCQISVPVHCSICAGVNEANRKRLVSELRRYRANKHQAQLYWCHRGSAARHLHCWVAGDPTEIGLCSYRHVNGNQYACELKYPLYEPLSEEEIEAGMEYLEDPTASVFAVPKVSFFSPYSHSVAGDLSSR